MANVLTATEVKNAKPSPDGKPRKLWDGGGLHLYVTPTVKSWRYKYRLFGKEHLFALGQFPHVGLAAARDLHAQARTLVDKGTHPIVQKKAGDLLAKLDSEDSFKAVAVSWMATKEAIRTPYYLKQIRTAMEKDVFPSIGGLPIRSVKAAHILAIIKSVEKRGASTVAINIRGWCSAVFEYAIANLKSDYDPVSALKNSIVRPKVKHNVALKPDQISELLKQMSENAPFRTTAIALELLLLTFVRTVELRKSTWDEFNLVEGVWQIPAKRMKMDVEHVVPLSTQAIKLLKELQGITGASAHLFPNNRRPTDFMTPTTINQALKRLGFSGTGTIGFSAHGFRGTAATLLYEKGYPPDVIERQLAHAERNNVKAAYNHAQYMPQRKKMMQEWADFVDLLQPQKAKSTDSKS